jgi:hypothetical protein
LLAHLGIIVASRDYQALPYSKFGCGNCVNVILYLAEYPLKAASALAKSFRGMEIAELLTDNFINNQETPPARMPGDVKVPCFKDEALQGLPYTSLFTGNVPDALVKQYT